MRSSIVIVLDVDAQHALEMTAGNDKQPVEALLPDCPHPSLRHRVRLGRSVGHADHPYAVRGKDDVEGGRELAVSIVDDEAHRSETVFQADAEVACLLDHPRPSGIGCAPADIHAPARELDKKQHIDPGEQHRLDGEEVTAQDTRRLLGQKLPPGRFATARRGAEPVAGKNAGNIAAETSIPSFLSSPWMRL